MEEADAEKQPDTKLIANQPYDESLEVNDSEEIASVYTPTPRQPASRPGRGQLRAMSSNNSSDEYEEEASKDKKKRVLPPGQVGFSENEEEDDDDDDSEESESDEDDDDEHGAALEGAYDPNDYNHLPVTAEIKELFQYINRYTPQTIELDHKLKPFIPDFIPAVGDIDAFLKVPRPDSKPDNLGLLVLDEPCTKQSDPTVLSLWLTENSKQHNVTQIKVKSLENAEKNPKTIDNWIESISELHRSKPPATVHYTKPMPDIDTLMQEWPPEFEELLGKVSLPTAEINCDLGEYIDIICAILDIPVYKNRIQCLHILFTLYSEFKNSQHFKALAEGKKTGRSSAPLSGTGEPETLTFD
ncbi:intraflagellar transport protein 46 homolog isoform X2 [Polyodon spathula]|uniref:intraflagellar transport protein 46 homolog isoform X2 n=1 Tax=Polyodon spathula TaxID=7913 RepID=UPI001B7F515F|nr:intraflagellar transport protein 46 homolog isoform X2 [Polyodon spathula]